MQQISGIKIYNKILINKLHTLFPFNKVGGGEGGGGGGGGGIDYTRRATNKTIKWGGMPK